MSRAAGSAEVPEVRGTGAVGHRWEPPGPRDAERGALPLHLQPIAGALFDGLPAPPPASSIDAVVAALVAGRDRLAPRVPAGSEIVVDAYRARLAVSCPASVAGDSAAFRWTPAAAARHLGLRAVALHHCGDAGQPPSGPAGAALEQAVAAVVAQHISAGGDRTPGPWLAQLDEGGRAVARAQAQRWAEQAVAWLPLRLVDRRCLRFLDDDWWPGGARSGRVLVVHGRRDVTLDIGGRRVAVTMAGGPTTAEAAAVDALTALAATLCDRRGRLVRVVRVHPASGEVAAADVTPALLAHGVEVVLSTAAAMAGGGAGQDVPTAPGPGCTWCHRLDRCPAGAAWTARPDRRSMGLPLTLTGLRPAAAPDR